MACAWEHKWGVTHCIPVHLGELLFAVSLETITALPLAGGPSRIQVETQASSCASEKRGGRNGGERLQMALKSAGLKVLITTD